jgi:TolB-like protein/tetratricopeptide (TPR) repeat protein
MANEPEKASQDTEPPQPGDVVSVLAPSGEPTPHSLSLPWLWDKIKRHKVAEWTLAYVAFSYAFLHGAELLSDAQEWPHVIVRVLSLVLILGVPIVATLAWFHGHRAQHRVSRVELFILVILFSAAGVVLWFQSSTRHAPDASKMELANAVVALKPETPVYTSTAFAPPAHSVAVLPFTNLSGDPRQEYFSDGVSEELINALAHIDALEVAARTSSFSFKGQNVDIATIARKLNVGAILEGSIRRSGNTVRITAQLINTVNGFHIWSQDYDRDLKNILALQTEVATTVAQQMQIKLLGDEALKIEAGGTHIPQAYDAFLRGQHLMSTADTETEVRTALHALDEAIALDPNYAAANALRVRALSNLGDMTADPHLYNLAREAAERSVALAPDLAEAHISLGWFVRVKQDLDFKAAAPEMERALELDPGSAYVLVYYAGFQTVLGHYDAAIAASQRAVRLDGQNYRVRDGLVENLLAARRYSEALIAAEDAKALRSDGRHLVQRMPLLHLALGQPELARQQCESPARHFCLALALHALGNTKAAEVELEKLKVLDGDSGAYEYAEVYAQWGDKKSALQWLSRAEQLRDLGLAWLKADWELDPVRNEPAFKALEKRMNFPP